MKKTALILAAASLFFVSCKKGSDNNNSKSGKISTTVKKAMVDYKIPDDANSEVRRIIDDVIDPAYTIAIIDNPNFGRFSRTPEADIAISGASKPDVQLNINGVQISSTADGQWYRHSADFKTLYGANNTIRLTDNQGNLANFSFYVPKQILAAQLSPRQSQNINRTGNTLRWSNDPNNRANKVALHYTLYNNQELGDEGAAYKRDIILLDATAPFNLDGILSDSRCQRIYFKLVTGNTFSTIFNSEKILFHISSYDHHEYMVN